MHDSNISKYDLCILYNLHINSNTNCIGCSSYVCKIREFFRRI